MLVFHEVYLQMCYHCLMSDNLYTYGYITVPEDKYNFSGYNKDERLQRAYCLLCLCEFVILCIPLWYVSSRRIAVDAVCYLRLHAFDSGGDLDILLCRRSIFLRSSSTRFSRVITPLIITPTLLSLRMVSVPS
jgi:hypothetical protein